MQAEPKRSRKLQIVVRAVVGEQSRDIARVTVDEAHVGALAFYLLFGWMFGS